MGSPMIIGVTNSDIQQGEDYPAQEVHGKEADVSVRSRTASF